MASDSFCTDIQESFIRNKGNKLSYIFNFRYQAIRKISIALTVVISSSLLLIIIGIIIMKKKCCEKLLCFLGFLVFVSYVAKFVLSLILYHFIESGDIGKYNDFLDCQNVRKEFFQEFKGVVRLRGTFLAFAVFNIIVESIDKAKELFENCGKEETIDKPVINMDSTTIVS